MSIQKIRTESSNPPKARKIVFLLSKKTFLIAITLPFIFGYIAFIKWDAGAALLAFILIFLLVFIGLSVFDKIKRYLTGNVGVFHNNVHDHYKKLAIRNGINPSYEASGIIIDDNAKKIVFTINPSSEPHITICDYSDIISYYQVSTNQSSTRQMNVIKVEIKDPSQPLHSFSLGSGVESDLWMARLSSIFSRQKVSF